MMRKEELKILSFETVATGANMISTYKVDEIKMIWQHLCSMHKHIQNTGNVRSHVDKYYTKITATIICMQSVWVYFLLSFERKK